MANNWELKVEIDVQEPRPGGSRLLAAADGTTFAGRRITMSAPATTNAFEGTTAENLWQCPATGTLMLLPNCFNKLWKSTYTGNYARFRKTDWSFHTPADWNEVEINATGDYYLVASDSTGTGLTPQRLLASTTLPMAANTPMYFSYYAPPQNTTVAEIQFQVRFGQYSNSNRVEVQVYTDGTVAVFKGGVQKGLYNKKSDDFTPNKSATSNTTSGNGYKQLVIIPYKNRQILIWHSDGFAVNHIFTDLNDVSGNTILPNDNMYVYMPSSGSKFQTAIVKFATSATAYGSPITWKYAPPSGATFTTKAYFSVAGIGSGGVSATYGLVKSNFSAYTANGTDKDVRCIVTFTGDTYGSIAVDCVDVYYDPPTSSTYSGAIDITTAMKTLEMSVEENGDSKISFSAYRQDLVDLAVPQYNINTDRPIRLAISNGATVSPTYTDFFRGMLKAPRINYTKGDSSAKASILTYDGVDRTFDANTMMIFAAVPYDNNTFSEIIADLWKQCGYNNSYLNISTSTFKVPLSSDIGKGKYNFIPEFGDTIGKKIDDLHQTYAATWLKGWFPSASGYKFNFLNRSTLSTTPKITLYKSWAEAVTGGVSQALIHNRVYFERETYYEPPEATAVTVIGFDPGINELIRVTKRDAAAETPDTAPISRPRNWAGRPIDYILTDPGINTITAANTTMDLLYDRLTQGRILTTITCEFLVDDATNVPIWIGDCISLQKIDVSGFQTYRVIAIPSIRFEFEDSNSTRSVRTAQYVLESISGLS